MTYYELQCFLVISPYYQLVFNQASTLRTELMPLG